MDLFIGNWIVKSIGSISKFDLLKIKQNNELVICFGEDSYWEEIHVFFVEHVENESQYCLVFYLESNVFPPHIVSNFNDNELLIVHYNHLTLFNLKEKKTIFSYQSDSVIYFCKIHKNTIVLISEISVVQFKTNGEILISYDLYDVLESFKFENNSIFYKTMSGTNRYLLSDAENF